MKNIRLIDGKLFVVNADNSLTYLSLGNSTLEQLKADTNWKNHISDIKSGDQRYFKYTPNSEDLF